MEFKTNTGDPDATGCGNKELFQDFRPRQTQHQAGEGKRAYFGREFSKEKKQRKRPVVISVQKLFPEERSSSLQSLRRHTAFLAPLSTNTRAWERRISDAPVHIVSVF